MKDEKARALGARLAQAAEAFAIDKSLPRPAYWSEWYVVTVVMRGGEEAEPTLLFPRTAPAGFEAFARAWLLRKPKAG